MTLTLQRTFLFDHLPKTGGTALRFAFEDMFGRENVTQHLEGRSEIWAMQKFSGFRVISGHFLSLIPNDGGRRARLTVLRHPIDRAVSEYYYWRHHALEGGVDDKLAQWAQRYDICDFFKARAESNETAATNFCTKHFAARISRDLVGDERLVALASRSLEKYDFVGIFEYLHDSVDMFCWQFGFPPVNRFPHVNVTQARISVADLDRPTLHRLTAMNDLDVRLYNHALTIFEAKKRHMLRELVLKGSRVRRARFGSPVTGSNALPKKFFQRLRRIISSGSPAQNPQLRPRSASVSAAGDSPMSRKQENFGSGEVEIVCVRLVGAKSGTNAVAPGETVSVAISVSAHADVSNLTVGFELSDSFGEVVFGTNSFLHHAVKAVSTGRDYQANFEFKANLNRGRYAVGVALHTGADHTERCFHWRDNVAELEIVQFGEPDFVGYCRLEPTVEWCEIGRTTVAWNGEKDDLYNGAVSGQI